MKKITLLIIIAFLVLGCNKNNNPKTTGEASLNSELILEGETYSVPGFSFESASVVLYNPAGGQTIPDIFALPDVQNNVYSAYFDTQNTLPSFALVAEFESSGEAQDFFNNYKLVDVNSYSGLAKPVVKNQVWVFKTRNDKYAKLLVVKVDAYLKDDEAFAEVTFKWVYQPDGSKVFP
jgi:hypothetical protein